MWTARQLTLEGLCSLTLTWISQGRHFEPIRTSSNYFLGVFDGQWHVISNLKIALIFLEYSGIFGYSRRFSIRNVILDSFCSVANYCTGSEEKFVWEEPLVNVMRTMTLRHWQMLRYWKCWVKPWKLHQNHCEMCVWSDASNESLSCHK